MILDKIKLCSPAMLEMSHFPLVIQTNNIIQWNWQLASYIDSQMTHESFLLIDTDSVFVLPCQEIGSPPCRCKLSTGGRWRCWHWQNCSLLLVHCRRWMLKLCFGENVQMQKEFIYWLSVLVQKNTWTYPINQRWFPYSTRLTFS